MPYVDGDGSADVPRDLWALSDQLQPLGQHLGHLDSYQDFAFLMDHMTAALPQETLQAERATAGRGIENDGLGMVNGEGRLALACPPHQ